MSARHTPGPWRLGFWSGRCFKPEHAGRHPGASDPVNPCVYTPEFQEGYEFGVATDDGKMVVTDDQMGGIVVSEADARLIAAAPDLLTSLANLLALIDATAGRITGGEVEFGEARDAIAKAEGRS